jgi:hypothetical protein
MSNKASPLGPAAVAVALALPVLASACGDNPAAALCCKDFQVGVDLAGADLGAKAEFKGELLAFAQAASDLSAVAQGMLDDVAVACRAIATDLGKDASDPGVRGKSGIDGVRAWCNLAKAEITASAQATGAGTLTVEFDPPKCQASLSAQASCEGGCKADASCTEPKLDARCEGGVSGKCEATCQGSCTGSPTAAASCKGSCSATCEGACEAQGGVAVDCEGTCSGACQGTCEGTTGAGGHCDGTCKGKCDAKCTARAGAQVKCTGRCDGKCTGECKLEANANVQCSGTCSGGCTVEYKEPKCSGEIRPPACQVKGDCKASCSASASAKAECSEPRVVVKAAGQIQAGAQAKFDALVRTLELHLPKLLVVLKARGQAFVGNVDAVAKGGAKIVANPGALEAKGVACAGAMVTAVSAAFTNASASLEASATVLGSVGTK